MEMEGRNGGLAYCLRSPSGGIVGIGLGISFSWMRCVGLLLMLLSSSSSGGGRGRMPWWLGGCGLPFCYFWRLAIWELVFWECYGDRKRGRDVYKFSMSIGFGWFLLRLLLWLQAEEEPNSSRLRLPKTNQKKTSQISQVRRLLQ